MDSVNTETNMLYVTTQGFAFQGQYFNPITNKWTFGLVVPYTGDGVVMMPRPITNNRYVNDDAIAKAVTIVEEETPIGHQHAGSTPRPGNVDEIDTMLNSVAAVETSTQAAGVSECIDSGAAGAHIDPQPMEIDLTGDDSDEDQRADSGAVTNGNDDPVRAALNAMVDDEAEEVEAVNENEIYAADLMGFGNEINEFLYNDYGTENYFATPY